MIRRRPTLNELKQLREIANLQFRGVGDAIIPDNISVLVSPTTLKIRALTIDDEIYMTLRAGDHRFVLHKAAAVKLNKVLQHPCLRVYVNENYCEFVIKGGNVFSKHVVLSDPTIRPGDEVLVHSYPTLELIATGRAIKPGWAMNLYSWGEAVRVKERIRKHG